MPVFDFNATPDEKKPAECTYTVIRSNENEATIEKPMMILDNKQCKWEHHSCGVFTNPIKRTSFEFQQEDGTVSADILKIDARFVSLLKWLGENHINVRLSGENTEEGYAVYKIREIAFGGGSSEMVLNNKILNNPSDGNERAVSVGLGLFSKKN